MEHPFKKNTLCVDVFSHAKKEDIHLLWINWVLWIVFNRKRRSHGALNWRKHRRQKPMISPVKLLKNPIQQNKKTIALKEGLERLGLNVDSNFQHNLVYTGCTYVLILVVPKPTMGVTLIAETWLFLPITCEQPLGFRTVSGEPKAPGICCEGTSFGTKEHITIALKWS